jgi:protein-tyrosine phosphatase
MKQPYSREIEFEGILNFRDLGGYKVGRNRQVVWRRLFRSGELHCMTAGDFTRLKEELKIKTIIDLRGGGILNMKGLGPVKEMGVRYHNVPLVMVDDYNVERRLSRTFDNLHDEYLCRVKNPGYGKRFIEVLEIISEPSNHPVIFHCNAGADRSGITSAIILDILGVEDKDIQADYALTGRHLQKFIDRWNNDPMTKDVHRNLPEYQLKLHPEVITALLVTLRKQYGSVWDYLASFGAEKSLFGRLEKALLVKNH